MSHIYSRTILSLHSRLVQSGGLSMLDGTPNPFRNATVIITSSKTQGPIFRSLALRKAFGLAFSSVFPKSGHLFLAEKLLVLRFHMALYLGQVLKKMNFYLIQGQ